MNRSMKRMRTGSGTSPTKSVKPTCQNLGCYHAASERLNRANPSLRVFGEEAGRRSRRANFSLIFAIQILRWLYYYGRFVWETACLRLLPPPRFLAIPGGVVRQLRIEPGCSRNCVPSSQQTTRRQASRTGSESGQEPAEAERFVPFRKNGNLTI
jgi:hypothetical protein